MNEENKVYLGNLDYNISEGEIEQAFSAKGLAITNVRVVKDKMTGRSKGFGFGEFSSSEDVEKAIQTMDGTDLNGRKLRVSRAQKRQ